MNKKEFLSNVISKSGLLNIVSLLHHIKKRNHLTILAYHRIYDMVNENSYPFDPELISATPIEFQRQMIYVKNNFVPVTFDTLIKNIEGKIKLPDNPIIITFDDGHKDNYTFAYPILKSLNIPATIFLSTEYIDSDKIFWFDWVSHMLYRTKNNYLSLNENSFIIKFDNNVTSRREASNKLLSYLKTIPNKTRLSCLSEISKQLSVEITDQDRKISQTLTWDNVNEMKNNGIEFGSHTVSHPILSNLNDNDLTQELKLSKEIIENIIHKDIDVIAYPVGGQSEYNKLVIEKCKKLNYLLGVSYISGIEDMPIKNTFSLKRLHVERYTNIHYFKSMLQLPKIFK